MKLNDLKILAVIPARGGSKGIPRKNLQKVSGISLVAHAAKIATSLEWIDKAIISSDDEEIINEGVKSGLEAPFIRPDSLSDDVALGIDVWRHAWLACEEYYGYKFDISVKLEPTSPLRTSTDVVRTMQALIDGGHPAAATVSPTPAHYSPHKTLTVNDSGIIGFYLKDGSKYSIRQKIPDYYHRNGICYAATRKHVVDNKMIIDENAIAVIIDRPIVNIDDWFELELAEWLFNRKDIDDK